MRIGVKHDHVGITLASTKFEEAVDWYSDKLDFVIAQRFEAHGSTFVFITNGDTKIELISAGAENRNGVPDSLIASHDVERLHHFCLTVPNMDETLAELESRGIVPFAGPFQVDQINQRIAFITDIAGTIIELTSPA
ncbi:VOC family protein [Nocardioides sp. 1609]|uniref:VOC family protein n=1 Tax=Nocardioides sp. 1609 TaxID=2508327 RepID=UPI001431BE53|nr:VOC family protein [Nocardioides sp. 1609]